MTTPCELSRVRALRARPDGTAIEGYIALWGSRNQRDCYLTWFDKNQPPKLGLEFFPIAMFYEHGFDDKVGKDPIGRVDRAWFDDQGLRFEGVLFGDHKHYNQILREVRDGQLATSSGTINYLAEFDNEGRFKTWYLNDLSLTQYPCEERMPAVAFIERENLRYALRRGPIAEGASRNRRDSYPDVSTPNQEGEIHMGMQDLGAPAAEDPTAVLATLIEQFGPEAVMQALQAMVPAAEENAMSAPPAGGAQPPATPPPARNDALTLALQLLANQRSQNNGNAEVAELRRQMQEMQARMASDPTPADEPATSAPRSNPADQPVISDMLDLRYDHMTPQDMAAGYVWMRALYNDRRMATPASEDYRRAMEGKVAEAIDNKQARIFNARSRRPFRANEIMGTTSATTGSGPEWVGTFYDTNLWESIRQEGIYPQLLAKGLTERDVPQGHDTVKLLLEGSDPTWYRVPETTSEDSTGQPQTKLSSSKFGTGDGSLTVAKMGAVILLTGELEEDSLISVIPEARRKLDISARENFEYVLINGDTDLTASTNINLIDGTPTATALGSLPVYTLVDGFLYNALINSSGDNSRDAGTLAVEDYLLTGKLMGPNGKNFMNRDRGLFIIDNAVYYATLQLDDVKSQDVFMGATIENGEITKIWGRDLYASDQMALANVNGKISATPGNNTLGRILALRPDQWVVGRKRATTTEVQRWARSDATELVTFMRWGLAKRDVEASAVSYNIAV